MLFISSNVSSSTVLAVVQVAVEISTGSTVNKDWMESKSPPSECGVNGLISLHALICTKLYQSLICICQI